jgi:hypothetical protein
MLRVVGSFAHLHLNKRLVVMRFLNNKWHFHSDGWKELESVTLPLLLHNAVDAKVFAWVETDDPEPMSTQHTFIVAKATANTLRDRTTEEIR